MESGKQLKIRNYLSSFFGFSEFEQDSEVIFRKIFLIWMSVQIGLFLIALFLPWYRFYNPTGGIVIDAGAFQIGLNVIFPMFCILLFSSLEVLILLIQQNPKITSIKILKIANVAISIFLISEISNPTFLPGLGGRFSDFITLFSLNFVGYQIIPMLGYVGLIAGMISSFLSAIYLFFRA
ncbi:MAG: hypothetical protein ACFFAJ_06085 [Candidatus Hodarchaeota archaeon]